MALNTIDIIKIMNPLQRLRIFSGVYAADCLPHRIKLPCAFIINTSPRSELQGHWIALYINKNGVAEYFDSFGFPPIQKDIKYFLRVHAKKIIYNMKQLQHLSSVKCGKFAIVFILIKMFGKSTKELTAKFSSNLMVNDLIVERIFKNLNNFISY